MEFTEDESGFYSSSNRGYVKEEEEEVETKYQVVHLEDETPEELYQFPSDDEEQEATLDFFNNGGYQYSNDDGAHNDDQLEVDPLQLCTTEEETVEWKQYQKPGPSTSSEPTSSTITLGLGSTLHGPIHPFSLKIPRLFPFKPWEKKKQPDLAPPPYSIEEAESTVRTFIDNCLSSRKDPQCRHQFYSTIHKVLNEALHQNLISEEEVDTYWKKFDEWASSATSYRLGDHYALQYRHKANDPNENPPKPVKIQQGKIKYKKGTKLTDVSEARLLRGRKRNLENSVKNYVLNSNFISLREDLYSRVKFYQTFHRFYNPGSELFLDFFWNALLNRNPSFYEVEQVVKKSTKIVLPPSPKKMKMDLPPLKFILPKPPSFSPPPEAPSSSTTSSKNLDMDRLVKLTINSCIISGKDPKSTHKFYWTIHRSLETVQSLNLPLSEIDSLWKKYDEWAELSYAKGATFQLTKVSSLYNDVSELPPPAKKITPKRPPELGFGYPEGVRQLLDRIVRGFILSARVTVNGFRDDLKKRRLFLDSYVHFLENHWDDEMLDKFWRRLLIDTMASYTSGGKYVGSVLPSINDPPSQTQGPRKFDMDRLIQICINSCVESGKDPKTTHKFYWTIHRSLETVSSLNLSKMGIDHLWKKYDDWADKAYLRRKPFKLDMTNHSEYYADVSELPAPLLSSIRPPKPSCIKKANGLGKWLEKVVRELIIERGSSTNNFRDDLEVRRRFLSSYVNFVPLEYDTDFVIDGYWRKLMKETIEDYKLYLELSEVAKEKMNMVGEAPPPPTEKRFSMDYLMRKVFNSCVDSKVDPRTTHRFYWTIHRCLQESQRLNPGNRNTSSQVDLIWAQYDHMARLADFQHTKYVLVEELDNSGLVKYVSGLDELEPPPPPRIPPPLVNQLFPNCPKSTALKKFLDQKVKQTLSRSGLVNGLQNGIMKDLKTRRGFFQDYLPYVEELTRNGEQMIDKCWRRLVTEKKDCSKKSLKDSTKDDSNPSSSSKKTNEVPFVITIR